MSKTDKPIDAATRVGKRTRNRSRMQFVLLIMLFVLPPVAAYVAWQYVGQHGVDTTTNNGTLINPAQPLDYNGLLDADGNMVQRNPSAGRWAYLLFVNGECDQACTQRLYLTRQTRIAVNKDIPRVTRVLVLDRAPDAALRAMLAREHDDLVWLVRAAAPNANGLAAGFAAAGQAMDDRVFLVDPLGNLMMFYPAAPEPRGMLKDLQKLLKVSQIG